MWSLNNALHGSLPSVNMNNVWSNIKNLGEDNSARREEKTTDHENNDRNGEDGSEDQLEIFDNIRRDEEIDLDEIDGVEGIDDDDDQFSTEAARWAADNGLERSFAKYYKLAKDRPPEDIKDLARIRNWRVRLRSIRYKNHGELGDFFVSFNFGWNFKLSKKFVRVKASAQNKKVDKNGRTIEKKRKWRWVKTGTRGVCKYTQVRKDVEKGKFVQFDDSIEFDWTGSYFELYTKVLHVEVWIWHPLSPNEFLGKAEKSLHRIASGEMNMSGPEWEIKTQIHRRGRREETVLGALEFQCIFQEVLSYNIKFQNWVAQFRPWHIRAQPPEGEEDYLYPYAVFRLHSAVNPMRKVSSRSKELRIKDDDKNVKIDLGDVASLNFVGTRLGLEEGMLFVDLYHNRFNPFKNDMIGGARIPLTSIVENGFLSSKLRWFQPENAMAQLHHAMTCSGDDFDQRTGSNRKLQKVGQIYGTVDIDADESYVWQELLKDPIGIFSGRPPARLHREFAQLGELDPPELRDYPPYNHSYLAINIIAARELIGADANGLSDPYATVEWAGQRLKTRTINETLNPYFDEVLYFQIRSFEELVTSEELAESPYVRITLWDADEAGSSDLLGSTKLYLHWITGTCAEPSRGEARVPQQHTITVQRRKPNTWGGGLGRLREDEIRTRIFSDELKLSGLPPGIDSFVKVKAWFRAPQDGDLKEPNIATRKANGTDLLLLPDMKECEKMMLLQCLCDNRTTDDQARRGLCEESRFGHRCRRLIELEQNLNKFPSAANLMRLMYNQFQIHDMLAVNQYKEYHFLPTYLQPMSPPKSMIADESEAQYLAIRTSSKPNLLFRAAQLVRSIEFKNADGNLFDGAVNIHAATWMSPDFFLSMKKGDIKAHCLLLANLFLGLSADAYVCLGWAERRNKKVDLSLTMERRPSDVEDSEQPEEPEIELLPHMWVMTRESDNTACIRKRMRNRDAFAAGDMDAGTNSDIDPSQSDIASVNTNGGAVKFWEVSRGAYYAPLPSRWQGQNDEKLLQDAKRLRPQAAVKQRTHNGKEAMNYGTQSEADEIGVHRNVRMLDEEDLVGAERELEMTPVHELRDQFVPVDEIFELSYGADGFAEPTHRFTMEHKPMHGSMHKFNNSEADETVRNGTMGDLDGLEDSNVPYNPEVALDSLPKERRQFIIEHRKRAKMALRYLDTLKDWPQVRAMPYRKLACVFNHQNLWVNIQNVEDPRAMTFEIEEGEHCGWLPVLDVKPGTQYSGITPHYPLRTLGPKLTEEKVSELQSSVIHEVQSGIENYRDTYNVGTRFAEVSSGLPRKIREVLEAKHELDMTDKIYKNGWIPDPSGNGGGGWESNSLGGQRSQTFLKEFRTLQSSCPAGFKARINFVKLNTSDAKEVRRVILRRRTVDSSNQKLSRQLFEEAHDGKETFAIGVKVIAFPSAVCVIHVGLMVVYPDTRRVQQVPKTRQDS